LRHFVDHATTTIGATNGTRVRHWFQEKKASGYAVLAEPQMPVINTLLDQAHNTIKRQLFAMKGFHHPGGSQQAFLTGLVSLDNLVPYQHQATHAGQYGVEVEDERVPTADWMLYLHNPRFEWLSMSKRDAPPRHAVECAFFRSSCRSSFRHAVIPSSWLLLQADQICK
jgi:hypothetical protein